MTRHKCIDNSLPLSSKVERGRNALYLIPSLEYSTNTSQKPFSWMIRSIWFKKHFCSKCINKYSGWLALITETPSLLIEGDIFLLTSTKYGTRVGWWDLCFCCFAELNSWSVIFRGSETKQLELGKWAHWMMEILTQYYTLEVKVVVRGDRVETHCGKQ